MGRTRAGRVRSLVSHKYLSRGGARAPGDEGKAHPGNARRTPKAPPRTSQKPFPAPRWMGVRKCLVANAVKTFCLNGTKLHVCESLTRCTKRRSHASLFKNRKRECGNRIEQRMTLTPQKAPKNTAKAASEASEHQTAQATQQIQSEVEERPKKNVGAKKSAQKQHDAQPEVATAPQGLDETQWPARTPGREDVVPGRRKSDEFALRVSEAALLHMAHREPGYLPIVKEAAYGLIYESERILCGHIVQLGNMPAVNLSRWWRAFDVDGLWFVLKPCELPRFSKVREYELLPASGPTPDDDVPPKLIRAQNSPPPDYIGPRRRRNRGDTNGVRAKAAKPPLQAKGRRRKDVKRVFTDLYGFARMELELLSQNIAQGAMQAWRARKPRLLRSVVEMRRFGSSCGTALRDLRAALASVVQTSRTFWVFPISIREASTRPQRQLASEPFGPSGRLESSNAGHVVSARLKLNSWKWDEPPLPWAEYLFGVDWTRDIFGVIEEEQVFT